jgi:hypothetical protein
MYKQLAVLAAVATLGLSHGAIAATPAAAVQTHHALAKKMATPVSSEVKTEAAAETPAVAAKTEAAATTDKTAEVKKDAAVQKVKKHKKHKKAKKLKAEAEAKAKAEKDAATPATTETAPAAN